MKLSGAGLLAVSAALMLCSCNAAQEQETEAPAEQVSNRTLASVIAGAEEFEGLSKVLSASGLGTVFDGPASYTVLAPGNDALASALPREVGGEAGLPIVVALLRDHILPGHLTPATIRQAIADEGGPVEMRTLGKGIVSFSLQEDKLVATQGGVSVPLTGGALVADNGVVLPLEGAFTLASGRAFRP